MEKLDTPDKPGYDQKAILDKSDLIIVFFTIIWIHYEHRAKKRY